MDPLAGSFAPWSPYNYVLGNPIILVDPDGRMATGPGDPPIVETLKQGFSSAMEYLKEKGVDESVLAGTEKAFDNLLENVLSGEITFSGELSATIGARVAAGKRVASPIPLVPLAGAQGDINLGSVELLTLKFDITTKLNISDGGISLVDASADAHGVLSSDPTVSFGGRGAVGAMGIGGFDIGGDIKFTKTKGERLSYDQSVATFSAGGAEYTLNFKERSVQVSSKFEVDYRFGAIITFSGKLSAGANGVAKF